MGLTERIVRDAKPRPKTTILWDGQVKGLGLRIAPGGTKSYILNYRVSGKERRATLARASEISLKAARERAGLELAAIRAGEADPLRRREEAARAETVNDGLDRFFEVYIPERLRIGRISPRTVKDYRGMVDRTLRPAIGKLRIEEVKRADIESAVAKRGRVQRNRTLALASRLFTLFEQWELRPQHSNPVRGIERAREEPRDRVFSPSELAALAGVLTDMEEKHPAAVAAIRFAALTGLRIGEVLAVRWQDVEFETGRLILPTTKTGRRQHDLPTPALELLAALPRVGEGAFTAEGRAPLSYYWCRIVFAMAAKAAGLEDVRLHDLRRTVMTRAAMAGVGTHVLRDLLGHKTTVMADRYVRAVGNPVREAREAVGNEIAAMMAGKSGEVVPLRGRHG